MFSSHFGAYSSAAKSAEAAACQRPIVRFGRKLTKVSGVVEYCGSPLPSLSRTYLCRTAKLNPAATLQSKQKACSWPASYWPTTLARRQRQRSVRMSPWRVQKRRPLKRAAPRVP
jgi:hypothetical protein